MKNKKFRINILLKGKDKEKDKVIVIDGDVYVSDSIVIEGNFYESCTNYVFGARGAW